MALNFPFKKPLSEISNLKDKPDPDFEFLQATNLFKTQREKLGVSLEALSNKTKISKNVLIAIENGWKKYLPERTYLISMLKILEIELDLERGSLNNLLAQKVDNTSLPSFNLNFINIDFLNSWIGSLLYLIFMFLSILALNSQHKYLIKSNSLTTDPILLNENDIEGEPKININNE